jgi:cell division protein FtsQ
MKSPVRSLHGASIAAPDETFRPLESPLPSAVDLAPASGSGLAGKAWLFARVLLGLVAVVGTSILVAASAHRYALTSPRFALQKLELKGGERFGVEQIRALGGLGEGQNLFALEPHAVESRLLENPWIQSAKINRRLPSTLEVEITERKARAIALIGDRLYVLSRDAEPFKQLEPKDPVDLPVVTGLRAENLGRDRERELERARRAIDVLQQYERLGMSRIYAAQEVHLSDGGSVTLTVGKEGIVLQLGASSVRQRLLMAERVVEESRQSGRLPGIVFADNQAHPERVVVRMR